MGKTRKTLLRWCFLAGLVIAGQVHASPITVVVNTTGLLGRSAELAFDLLQGAPTPNSVVISGFGTDGVLGLPNNPPFGGVSGGPLPDPVTLTDTDFYNSYLQYITLGNSLTFTFDPSGSATSTDTPAGFAFFILDASDQSSLVETSEPAGSNALFLYSIGNPNPFEIFDSSTPGVDVRVKGVPEPGALALLMASLLALVVVRSVRRKPLRRGLAA